MLAAVVHRMERFALWKCRSELTVVLLEGKCDATEPQPGSSSHQEWHDYPDPMRHSSEKTHSLLTDILAPATVSV